LILFLSQNKFKKVSASAKMHLLVLFQDDKNLKKYLLLMLSFQQQQRDKSIRWHINLVLKSWSQFRKLVAKYKRKFKNKFSFFYKFEKLSGLNFKLILLSIWYELTQCLLNLIFFNLKLTRYETKTKEIQIKQYLVRSST